MGAVRYWDILVLLKDGIVQSIKGEIPFEVTGPVGIAQTVGEVARTGISNLLYSPRLSVSIWVSWIFSPSLLLMAAELFSFCSSGSDVVNCLSENRATYSYYWFPDSSGSHATHNLPWYCPHHQCGSLTLRPQFGTSRCNFHWRQDETSI